MKRLNILVVEDDDLQRLGLVSVLNDFGKVDDVNSSIAARDRMEKGRYDVAFFDLDLEYDLAGLDLVTVANSKGIYPVVLSARDCEKVILKAYQNGCEDFLAKPYKRDVIEKILRAYNYFVSPQKQGPLESFITEDKEIRKQLESVKSIIKSDQPVLLLGPTGTGKSFLAKKIHEIVFDNDKFVALNCAELPDNLLESELFGYEPGAFSGANTKKLGKLSLADGGTLFLDEIATMSPAVQQKLLKAIEEQEFYPLGGTKKIKTKFRLTSATCEDLGQMVESGDFRKDLYYRIDGFKINLKPLASRMGDIPALIRHLNKESVRRVVYQEEAINVLMKYNWPGNVRELKKINKMLQLKGDGIIRVEDLPEHIIKAKQTIAATGFVNEAHFSYIEKEGIKDFLRHIKKEVITHYLNKNDNKVRETVKELGLSNNSFYKIMKDI